MEYAYDYAVFIGRFQPLHKGHTAVIDKALSIAKHVIVLVGSANLGRTIRNPFSYDERYQMLDAVYSSEVRRDRLIIQPLNDHTYHLDGWLEEVQTRVRDIVLAREVGWRDRGVRSNLNDSKVTLIGRSKDNTSFYLKLFPNWGSEDVFEESVAVYNATDLRNEYFTKPAYYSPSVPVPVEVSNILSKFRTTPEYENIRAEHEYCVNYKKPFEVLPYAPTFNTVDVVVKCSGHILLITRRARPGKGLLALPGGFLDPNETLLEGALRETNEETRFKNVEQLKPYLVDQRTFDEPHRDPRGRFITQAFYFDLGNQCELPKVRGGSDASKAQWVPIADLRADNMFADHYFIVRSFINA